MKKLWIKLTTVINKVLGTKIGKFLFEVMNTLGLLILTIYMFVHVQIVFGLIGLFFLLSNLMLLTNKYNKKN